MTHTITKQIEEILKEFEIIFIGKKPVDLEDGNEVVELLSWFRSVLTTLTQEAREEGRNEAIDLIVNKIPEIRHKIKEEYKDRRANGFNECRKIILKELNEARNLKEK